MTDEYPKQVYDIVPMRPETRGPTADWWTVTCNGIPDCHFADRANAERYVAASGHRSSLVAVPREKAEGQLSNLDETNFSRLFDATDLIPTSEKSSPQAAQSQVSFLITRVQKERLREMGYEQVAIDEMKPELAHSILKLSP